MYVNISCGNLSPKKVYILHIAGYNNKSDNIISVMQRRFHCSLHVLVLLRIYTRLQTLTLSALAGVLWRCWDPFW